MGAADQALSPIYVPWSTYIGKTVAQTGMEITNIQTTSWNSKSFQFYNDGDGFTFPDWDMDWSKDFTIEFWGRPNGGGWSVGIGEWNNAFSLGYENASKPRLSVKGDGWNEVLGGDHSYPTIWNQWNHYCATYDASIGLTKFYWNGVNKGQTSTGRYIQTNNAKGFSIGGKAENLSLDAYRGWMSDIRVSDVIRYPSNFTPHISKHLSDSNTILLLHGDSYVNDAPSVSTQLELQQPLTKRAYVETTAYGGVSINDTDYKTGYGSIEFSGEGAAIDTGQTLIPASGDWTVEGWFKFHSVPTDKEVWLFEQYDNTQSNTNGRFMLNVQHSNSRRLRLFYGSQYTLNGSTTILANQWYHIAAQRSGNTHSIYLNGQLDATGSDSSAAPQQSATFSVGEINPNGSATSIDGLNDNIRISSTARYTGNFTPSTAEYDNDEDTLLLINGNASWADQLDLADAYSELPVDVNQSSVSVDDNSPKEGDTITYTVILRNAQGNTIDTATPAITVSTNNGSVSTPSYQGNGAWTFTHSRSSTGTSTITIGYDGTNFPTESITYTPPITFYSNIEFQANDIPMSNGTTSGRSTDLITVAGGNLCVHWADYDGSTWRSYIRILTPTGVEVAPRRLVANTNTVRMASHTNQNFIAVGYQEGGQLYTKRYDLNLNEIGSRHSVGTFGSTRTPSIANVAMNSLGNYCASVYTYGGSWGSEGNPGIIGYNSSGSVIRSAQRVSDDGSQTQSNAWVNALTNNKFCYTFNTIRGGRHYTPKGQMLNSSCSQTGGEFWIAQNYTGRQYSPINFALPNGDWMATWKSNHPGGSTSFSKRSVKQNVYARIFRENGSARSSEFRVNNTQWNGNGSPWGEPYLHDSDTFRIMFSAPTDQSRYSAGGQWERPYSFSGSSQGNDYRANTYGTEKGNNHAYISNSDGGSRAYTWPDGTNVKIRSKNVWG